jgi:hypothetical protein
MWIWIPGAKPLLAGSVNYEYGSVSPAYSVRGRFYPDPAKDADICGFRSTLIARTPMLRIRDIYPGS